MKLQILVPQYAETESTVKPLLESIAIQQNVDFREIGVIICNDGSDTKLSANFLSTFPFSIEYHQEPHRGVSGTRNACLDYATADYVMFCDADDMFVNNCGLYLVFKEISVGFDALNSAFIEETRDQRNNEVVYITHEMDATFIHGKVYRRQYLIDNKIRWNENLTIHEDSFFNVLALNLSENVKYNTTPFYLWKWRDDSVCRADPTYMLKTYNNLIDSNDALIDEFIKRGVLNLALYYVVYLTFQTYYTMNTEKWVKQESQEHREKTEKRFAEFFEKRKDMWDAVSTTDKVNVSERLRENIYKEGMLLEAVTIFDWLKQIRRQ